MKTLYLIRHAKSSWKDDKQRDFDRPLNKRGKRDAPLMAEVLKKIEFKQELLLISSPAKRTQITAKIMAEQILYPLEMILYEEDLYHADVPVLLHKIRTQSDDFQTIILFGHNPSLTDFSNRLCKKSIENIPTTGIVCINFETDCWHKIDKKISEFVFFDYPKKHLK